MTLILPWNESLHQTRHATLYHHIQQVTGENNPNLVDIDNAHLLTFITTNPSGSPQRSVAPDVMRLRRNVIHAARLALAIATDAPHAPDPIDVPELAHLERNNLRGKTGSKTAHRGKRTTTTPRVPTKRPYGDRTHVRPATHDEVALVRLGCQFVETSTTRFLCTAITALATSTASIAEIPQVLWGHLDGDQLTLPGNVGSANGPDTNTARRVITLDTWATDGLDNWRAENTADHRRPRVEDSITYTGRQALTSPSAKSSADGQFRKATQVAGIDTENGLTIRSFRLWAIAQTATDAATAVAAAERGGTDITTLHRHLRLLGDRS